MVYMLMTWRMYIGAGVGSVGRLEEQSTCGCHVTFSPAPNHMLLYQIHTCEQEAEAELSALAKERERVHMEYCDSCGVDASEPYGDWGADDHAIFVKASSSSMKWKREVSLTSQWD